MGKRTITGMLTAGGQQFMDWSSAYRLFSQRRIDTSKIFDVASEGVLQEIKDYDYITAHMDDTILKKTGKHVYGASWRRDPLGPMFRTNLIWGQRFLQISMALPDQQYCSLSRAIPVDLHHCPTVKKPGKTADSLEWENYKEQKKITKLSKQGSLRIKELRDKLDSQGGREKQLLLSVDGSYTNTEVLKTLPERVILIGRIRKDTKQYSLPDNQASLGRKRVYGERLPTPEQLRQSEDFTWYKVNAFAAGKMHQFNVKVIKNVRWRASGDKNNLQLVVIRPLGYRLTKESRVLYRQPAYLICTDPFLNIIQLLQSYLWRWEIEVNFREEKTLFGCGQAQARNPESAESVPAFIASIYALLHIAAYKSLKAKKHNALPRPKWYQKKKNGKFTSGDLINNFRAQMWVRGMEDNFSSFIKQEINTQSCRNRANPLISSTFYVRN